MATGPTKLDPQGARQHTRIGIWDIDEEREKDVPPTPSLSRLERFSRIRDNAPYVVRMFKEILSIRQVRVFLPAFLVAEVLDSLIPAISLWYYGQLLQLVDTAMESRTVDITVVVHVAIVHVACAVATHLLQHAQDRIAIPIKISIRQFYAKHIFHSMARLDLPTFTDLVIQGQLSFTLYHGGRGGSIAWQTVHSFTSLAMSIISMLSQLLVLFIVLRKQQDGPLLVVLGFSKSMLRWYKMQSLKNSFYEHNQAAATTTNKDYIRMQGLKILSDSGSHRKELVAGNLSEFITSQFCESAQRLGDDASEFAEVHEAHYLKKRLSITSILRVIMHELPQIVFMLNAVQNPMTVPLSFASLVLIERVSDSFVSARAFAIGAQFARVRDLYEFKNMQNKVVDGTEPFPENQQSLSRGISVEFKDVSFQYPGKERYALHNVSFRIEASQLCVIVGGNGSGKSTILKLISRIYDPTEGTIFIDNRDIKTLRLADLRAAMSILFQDYTTFPLSIRENIGFGNPALAHDDDKIREAAKMGGARDFIDELPNGFSTYIGDVLMPSVRNTIGVCASMVSGLSGGQHQRLAVSRTFMRSLVTEKNFSAGMLLFDEPSASLDPTAEDDLFENLRKLRGSKTMIFSTHRFGNLTRHADLILYMDQSVQEQGTHDELMRKGGEYARIWNLQAKPFL
ncbi:P-loop containing nucleoside triphosphate hydrolase protein [Suillus clintonianus]|uniref:P-loop containing nucleoside triphosphate hydrolase protein n=1 Tax=Suillus clintonianus TaxID=1904413 RepID=UPI001B861C2C|nr:P-loop containing nucleoside triphosphate hydrolase protein [Suillus clintonianus]KAG2132378.1 P-loop containing nucleoside triphosphate hydrolase protein [Suillus clintonianus]